MRALAEASALRYPGLVGTEFDVAPAAVKPPAVRLQQILAGLFGVFALAFVLVMWAGWTVHAWIGGWV